MVSYKRYASNLVVANIIATSVWILLSLTVVKKLDEVNNRVFIVASLAVITSTNILSAYFGITGIIRRYTCELTTYYILTRIAIISECFIYLLILFTGKQYIPYHSLITTVQIGVAIIVIITQIWLFYETKNFENLAKLEIEGLDDFRVRRMSSPQNICDIERNSRIYALTDQLMVSPMLTPNQLNTYENDSRHQLYNCLRSPSMSFGGPVYQPLSTPLMDESPQSIANQWYLTSQSNPPAYKP